MLVLYKFNYNNFGPQKHLNPNVVKNLITYYNSFLGTLGMDKTITYSVPKVSTDLNVLKGFLGRHESGDEVIDRLTEDENGINGLDQIDLIVKDLEYAIDLEGSVPDTLKIKTAWRIKPRIAYYEEEDIGGGVMENKFQYWEELPTYEYIDENSVLNINIEKEEDANVYELRKSLGIDVYNLNSTPFDFNFKYFKNAVSGGIDLDMTGIWQRNDINDLNSDDGGGNAKGTNQSDFVIVNASQLHLTEITKDDTTETGQTFKAYKFEVLANNSAVSDGDYYFLNTGSLMLRDSVGGDKTIIDGAKDGYLYPPYDAVVPDESVITTEYEQRIIRFYINLDSFDSHYVFLEDTTGAIIIADYKASEAFKTDYVGHIVAGYDLGKVDKSQLLELRYDNFQVTTITNFNTMLTDNTTHNGDTSYLRKANRVPKLDSDRYQLISGFYPSVELKVEKDGSGNVFIDSSTTNWKIYKVISGRDKAIVEDAGTVHPIELNKNNRILLSMNDSNLNGSINRFIESETGEEYINIEQKLLFFNPTGTDADKFTNKEPEPYPSPTNTPDTLTNRLFLEIVRELVDGEIFSRNFIMVTDKAKSQKLFEGVKF